MAAQAMAAGSPPAGEQPDRLVRALEGLRAALARQAGTIAAWRASLAELEGSVLTLQAGLTRHAGAVQGLGETMAQLGTPGGLHGQPGPR